MAQTWTAKAPTEVVERRWVVPLADTDSISTVSAVGTAVTVDSTDSEAGEAVVVLSGGSAEAQATVAVTVTTTEGLTYAETFAIAIRDSAAAFFTTVQDVVNFALRKVTGVGVTPEADELADGVELFNGMIALWRINGMDVGIAGELIASDSLDIPDEFILPIKYALRRLCHSTYHAPLTATDEQMAIDGERLISNRLLSLGDLDMPAALARRPYIEVG